MHKVQYKNNLLFFHSTTAQCLATSVAWAWNIFLTGLLTRGFATSRVHGSYYLHVCIIPSAQGAYVEDFSLSPVSRWVPGLRFPDRGVEIERTWTTDSTTSTLHILRINFSTKLRYHRPSSTLLALIGASAFAFNKHPHKPYIFWKLNSSRLLLISFKKSKY